MRLVPMVPSWPSVMSCSKTSTRGAHWPRRMGSSRSESGGLPVLWKPAVSADEEILPERFVRGVSEAVLHPGTVAEEVAGTELLGAPAALQPAFSGVDQFQCPEGEIPAFHFVVGRAFLVPDHEGAGVVRVDPGGGGVAVPAHLRREVDQAGQRFLHGTIRVKNVHMWSRVSLFGKCGMGHLDAQYETQSIQISENWNSPDHRWPPWWRA